MSNILNFFRAVKQEILKVVWPSKKETTQGALTIIMMSVIAALFFLLIDQLFRFGLTYLIG